MLLGCYHPDQCRLAAVTVPLISQVVAKAAKVKTAARLERIPQATSAPRTNGPRRSSSKQAVVFWIA